MNRRRTVRAIVLALLVATPAAATLGLAAPWQPDEGDWATLKGDAAHDGAASGKAAFDLLSTGLRLKWQRIDDPGYWVPPVAADLDGDGIAEVAATVANVSADPTNLADPVSIRGGFNLLDGKTGALRWKLGPTTGNLPFFSPTLADVNGDGKGDLVFLDGAPLTGSSTTNKVFAYSATGTQLWSWSDTSWGTKVPLPVTQVAFGNVDGEATHREVVALVLLANIVTSIQGGKVQVAASNPEYRLVALNGETNSPSAAWKLSFGNASASSPALGDLDGDGILDVVFGSGIKPGTWVETDSARVTFSDDFADDRLLAYKGGSGTPSQLWARSTAGQYPGDTGSAPVLADLDGDGRPDVVETLWVRSQSPTTADTGVVNAWSHAGTLRWSRTLNASIMLDATIAPPAVGDLDGDGLPEVVVQTGNGAATDAYRTIALRGSDGSVLWRASLGRVQSGSVAIADLDSDGDTEVVGILRPGTAPELYALDGATGALRFTFALPSSPSNGSPILADLDGDDDGRLEVLLNTGAWGQSGQLLAYEPELPDLRVAGLGFSAVKHELGVAETARATVSNVGSRTASSLAVDFFDGPTLVHTATITLAPGASQLVEAPWTPASTGDRAFKVQVDRAKAVPEWVETDNSVSAPVHIGARPVCALGLSPAAPDEGQPVTFTDQSTDPDNNIVTRAWTFGDGQGGSGASVQRAYADGGLYTVGLTVTDADGFQCQASQGLAVSHLAPAAAFDVSTAQPNELQAVVFTDRSTHPTAADAPPAGWAWAWGFGDGSASSTRSPVHQFPDGGTYSVSLQVTDNDGLGSTAQRSVGIAHVGPVAAFGVSEPYPDLDEPVAFTDASTHPASWDAIVAWAWDFDDGSVSSEASPTHAFGTRGMHTVRLTVTDDDGLSHTASRTVNVGDLPPQVAFAFTPEQPRGGAEVRFTDASTDDGAMVAWAWDLGDGATSALRNVTHRYPYSGEYQVTLSVTDNLGQVGTLTRTVVAINDPPAVAFTFLPEQPRGGAPVQFQDASTDDMATVAWAWDFGDGTTSAERHPTHRYPFSGTYQVTLQVTDDVGQVGARTRSIVAINDAPAANFTFSPDHPIGGEPVQFTDRSSDDGAVVAWRWSFGDGATSPERHPSHRYGRTGDYAVTLEVTDDVGQVSSRTALLGATNDAPLAAFTHHPEQPNGGEPVQFTDASTDDGGIVAWAWDFGDGQASAERSPAHKFTRSGTYQVTLTVTDAFGLTGTASTTIEATNSAPHADFTWSPDRPQNYGEVQFADRSRDAEGPLVSWSWDLGDGTTSEARNPAHRYRTGGSYPVSLTVVDEAGASTTVTKVVEVCGTQLFRDGIWLSPRLCGIVGA